VLRERYRLDVLIATGGVGEVWRGTDLAIDRRVAIKVLRPEHEDDEEGLARFRAEAHHAGSLSHPNIAQVFDYGEPAGAEPGYLVMELVDGLSLSEILADGPLSPEDAMDVVAQAALGLAAAHRTGLVHRDIKPGNLLLRWDGLVKITDFGIAHADGQTTFTQPGMLIGTPAYLAPERVAGGPATPAGDLYALGVVAHQCLTGQVPFAGEALVVALAHLDRDLPALPPSVPPDVAALVTSLTRKDPAARPPSAWDVALWAEQLQASLSSPEVHTGPGPAAAPLAVPGAEGGLLAGAGLAGTGLPGTGLPGTGLTGAGLAGAGLTGAGLAGQAGAGPDPARAGSPADWARTPPRGGRPRPRGSRRGPGRSSPQARGALAATGLAAIAFIAWTLATLPGPAQLHSQDVAPPATHSSARTILPRQRPLAATGSAGSGGNAVVAQAAATPQPSSSSARPARSKHAAPTPSSTPGTPSQTPTPSTSPTPTTTPTPSTPPPTPTSPAPTSPPPSTSAPAPTTPVPTGSLTSSTSLLPTASASSGLTILASGPFVT
jgi:serine/threonine-protein kinase